MAELRGTDCRGVGRKQEPRVCRTGSIPTPTSSPASRSGSFRGPSWLYACLEAEIPNPGDFKRSRLGAREVVAVRNRDGAINVLVNRCAHRSMQFCMHEPRHGEGIRLPLSPMDLRSRRQIARPAVPPRLQGAGRHAGRFRPGRARARKPRGRLPQRRRLRQLRPAERDARNLSRAKDARLFRPRLRRAAARSARLHAPAHPEQLEADDGEHQGPVPCEPVACVPDQLRAVPRRPGIVDGDGRDRPPRGAGQPPRRERGDDRRRPVRCARSASASRCRTRA